MPNHNEEPVASTSTKVKIDAVYYQKKNQSEVTAFKKSTDYGLFKEQYERAIDQLIAFSDENNIVYSVNDGTDVAAKEQFISFKEKIFKSNTLDHDSHLYYQAKQAVEKIAQLLEGKETSKENKITSLRELATNILQCSDGACSYIVKTRLQLSGNVGTLSERMQVVKQQLAELAITQYVWDNRESINQQYDFLENFSENNSVHVVAMYMNLFSELLNIPHQPDQYVDNISVSTTDHAAIEKTLHEALTPYSITAHLAEKYQNNLREIVGENTNDHKLVTDAIDSQEAIYGNVMNAVISFDDDDVSWQIRQDPTLLQVAIAKKLANEIPLGSSWPINWAIPTLTEEEGKNNKLQQIGDLFWLEKKDPNIPSATITSEPRIQDFPEPISFDQMASGQLIRLLEQAPANDDFKAFFQRIKPEQLQAANSAQMTALFAKLGYDNGITYAKAHPDGFSKLDHNPLIATLLALPDDQLAQIDSRLLYRMNGSQLHAFTAKLGGGDQLLRYVKTHKEWFKNSGEVLLKTNFLTPAILRLKGDERTDILPDFLRLMTYSHLQQFFEGMGELKRVITYCESHELWFENLLENQRRNPLLPYILTFSGDQLAEINPRLLGWISDHELVNFFTKMANINTITRYIEHYADWFEDLHPNPLVAFSLQLPSDQLVNVPSTFLKNMYRADLDTFIAKLGSEKALQYAQKNVEFFKWLLSDFPDNPLLPHILQLSGESLTENPPDLLYRITDPELTLFFQRMGSLKLRMDYAQSHVIWFNRLNVNPLLDYLLPLSIDTLLKTDVFYLQRMSQDQLETFFAKFDASQAFDFAKAHHEWFVKCKYTVNRFISFISTLSAKQLSSIPAAILLHKVLPRQVGQWLEKMGSEGALQYINTYAAGFQAQNDPDLYRMLNEIPRLSIDVKRALLDITKRKIGMGMHYRDGSQFIIRLRMLNQLLTTAIQRKDEEMIRLVLFCDLMSKNEIPAAISLQRQLWPRTAADETGILEDSMKFLDTVKDESATPENRIAAAMRLSHDIGVLGGVTRDLPAYKVFLGLDKSINNALFKYFFLSAEHDLTNRLQEWMKNQPELGAFFYLKIAAQDSDIRSLFTESMLSKLKNDSYCRSLQGFNGPTVDNLSFEPTFHISLGEQYHPLQALLLQAQASGMLVNAFLNEATQSLHLGYTYQQLIDLSAAHPQVKAVIDLVKQVVQAANADGQEQLVEMLMLDKYADKQYLYQLQRERLNEVSLSLRDEMGLSSAVPEVNQRPVNEWVIPDMTIQQDGGTMDFAGQIILQLEDDVQVLAAAQGLAGKHPKLSVIVQLDAKSHPRVVYGDPSRLQGKLRWQVVGHGRGGEGERNHQTLGGRTASELAVNIKQLSAALRINHAGLSQDLDPTYVSLVGCSLTDQDNQRGYAYQFGTALSQQGIRADIGARHVRVDVNQYGEKITEDHQGNWQRKISTDKVVLRWDKQGKVLGQDYNTNILNEKNELLNSIELAENFQQAMTNLYRSNHLQADKWLPVLSSLTERDRNRKSLAASPKSYSIEVVSQTGNQTRKLTFNDSRIIDFIKHYDRELASVSQQYQASKEKDASSADFTHVEAIDGLNAGIIVKTLIPWFANKSRTAVAGDAMPSTLNTALQLHTYVGLTQMAHGALEDMAKISKLYQAVVSERKAVSSGVSSLGKISSGVGIVLNLGSVVLDGTELAHAQNAAQKAVFGTQLAFDVAGFTSSTVGIGSGIAADAGVAGAATVGGVAGALAVPLAGLGIGFTGLAEAFGKVAAKAEAVGNYFADLDAAYKQGGYRRVEKKLTNGSTSSLLEPIPGAVIQTLDLKNKQLTFDSQYFYRNDPKLSVGSGESNYFAWWPGRSYNSDKMQAVNIREGIGYTIAQVSFTPDNGFLILPMTPKSFIGYDYMFLPFCTGRHDRGFDVLRRLEKDGRFDYDFYAFPSERIIYKITPEFVSTPIKVILDAQDRDIIMPLLPDAIHGTLSYQLMGDGAEYRVSLQKGCAFSLQSDNPATRWRLDARALRGAEDGAVNIDIYDDHLQIGDVRITLDSQLKGMISVIDNNNTCFVIDLANKKKTLLKIDESHMADWQDLHQRLKLLTHHSDGTANTSLIPVEHYRPAASESTTHQVGRAFYDVSHDRFIYTNNPEASEFLSTAELSKVSGDKAWFYRGTDIWQVNIADGKIVQQYLPMNFDQHQKSQGNQLKSRMWQDSNGQLYLAIEQPKGDYHIKYTYRVEATALKLLEVASNAPLENMSQQSLEQLSAQLADHGWFAPSEKFITTEHQIKGVIGPVVSVSGKQNNREQRCWLFVGEQGLQAAVIANLPVMLQDIELAFVTPTDNSGYYFYSQSAHHLYFQENNGLSGTPATLVDIDNIKSVFKQNQQAFALTDEGVLWLLNNQGSAQLAGLMPEWLHLHRQELMARLEQLSGSTPHKLNNLLLPGIQDSAGYPVIAWYDSVAGRVVQSGSNVDAKHRLHYLGLTHDSRQAWLFDMDSQRLYRQPVSDAVLTLNEQLVPLTPAENATMLPSIHKYTGAVRVDDTLRLETADGATVILPINARLQDKPTVATLQINGRQDTEISAIMEAMRRDYQLSPVTRLLARADQAPAWYLSKEQKILRAPALNALHILNDVGQVAGQTARYIHDQTTGVLWSVQDNNTTQIGNYDFIHLEQGNLLLEVSKGSASGEIGLPQVEGGHSLIIQNRSAAQQRYRLSDTLLRHYSQIVIDDQANDAVIWLDSVNETGLSLQHSGHAWVLYDTQSGSGLQIDNIEATAQRGMKLQIAGSSPQALSVLLKEIATQTALSPADNGWQLIVDQQGQLQLFNVSSGISRARFGERGIDTIQAKDDQLGRVDQLTAAMASFQSTERLPSLNHSASRAPSPYQPLVASNHPLRAFS
ncbi:TcdA/TcdB pore-forming domain-containing protein [Candidatus Regiella endosymbiont of Tuberolachnus salignus]|uniref:TcdA/TcdB pore-forming domain-containing protein n=1 Tax=Candidatus Regiella endosymbiont of Tuberolachnus salignus TaxID=3077956 RepID=UPI0030CF0956